MSDQEQTKVGAGLLEIIGQGMYSQPLHCIREYVQNAFDSIRTARRDGLLGDGEGCMTLSFDEEGAILRLRDNGTGIGFDEASQKLRSLGSSEKTVSRGSVSENAGFRGIGRMAGLTYCDTLLFRTSTGNGEGAEVTFNARGIKALGSRELVKVDLAETIDEFSDVSRIDEHNQERYFEVELRGCSNHLKDMRSIVEYLEQVAPVPFDNTWIFRADIEQIAASVDCSSSLDTMDICVVDSDGNVKKKITRAFRKRFQSGQNRVIDVDRVLELSPDAGAEAGWWGWIAEFGRDGALKSVPYAGLRLRQHNIEIGDGSIIRDQFKSKHLADWVFGEIHIVDGNIIPNAQRDNFEASDYWERMKEEFRNVASNIEASIRKESDSRRLSLRKVKPKIERHIAQADKSQESGFRTSAERKGVSEKLRKAKETVEASLSSKARTGEEKKELQNLRRKIERRIDKVEQTRIGRSGPKRVLHSSKKDRDAMLKRVLKVLESELNAAQFRALKSKIRRAIVGR